MTLALASYYRAQADACHQMAQLNPPVPIGRIVNRNTSLRADGMGVAQDVTLTLARLRRGLVASGADDLFRGKGRHRSLSERSGHQAAGRTGCLCRK
jgi:hypothetical protein